MTPRYFKAMLAFMFLIIAGSISNAAVVYQNGFENMPGNGVTTASPWTGAPTVFGPALTGSSWATSYSGGFISYDGSCGTSACQSLSISHNNYPASTTYTLTFTIDPNYTLNITGISFWNRESTDGPATANITINSTAAISNITLAGTAGANTGTLTPVTNFTGLTGTFTLVMTLAGATSTAGTFRLDDFVIDGSVHTPVTKYNVTGGGGYCTGSAGVTVGLANSDTGVNYQLISAGSNVGTPVTGTGSTISFGTLTTAGTYTVLATNNITADTATMNGSAIIVVNPLPIVSLVTPATQCGGTVTLDAGNAGSTFAWSDNTVQETDVVSSTNTYSVTVTDANTCSASASVTVTIDTLPAINITPSNPNICSGSSSTLTAGGGATYLWSNSLTTTAITVHPSTPTTYTVTGTDNNNCSATASSAITLSAGISDTVNAQICFGLSYGGHAATNTYIDTFSSVGGCDSIRTLTLVVLPANFRSVSQTICAGQSYLGYTTSGTFNDTLTSFTGCDSIISLQLTVMPVVTSSTTQTICGGSSYNGHTASGNFSDTLTSIQGCDSIISLALTVMPTISYSYAYSICRYDTFMGHTTTGIYTDTLLAVNGCDSFVYLNLTVNALPHVTLYLTFDTVCSNAAAITMSGGLPAGGYYSGQGISNSQFVPASAPLGYDTIYYNYTDSNGCFKSRYEFAYTQNCTDSTDTATTGIKYVGNTTFSVMPNPAQDHLTIENTGAGANYIINLYDLLGRLVLSQPLEDKNTSSKTVLNLQQLPAGLYLLNIMQGNTNAGNFKIVKD